jgi:hypothetical protein
MEVLCIVTSFYKMSCDFLSYLLVFIAILGTVREYITCGETYVYAIR